MLREPNDGNFFEVLTFQTPNSGAETKPSTQHSGFRV